MKFTNLTNTVLILACLYGYIIYPRFNDTEKEYRPEPIEIFQKELSETYADASTELESNDITEEEIHAFVRGRGQDALSKAFKKINEREEAINTPEFNRKRLADYYKSLSDDFAMK